eukprot:1328947-Pyramimonas_sp.AAC.2
MGRRPPAGLRHCAASVSCSSVGKMPASVKMFSKVVSGLASLSQPRRRGCMPPGWQVLALKDLRVFLTCSGPGRCCRCAWPPCLMAEAIASRNARHT